MNLREKRTINGELGMSSMTDILFILLMFFMMASTLTAPTALALSLPGRSTKNERLTDQKRITHIDILADGAYLMNGRDADTLQIRLEVESLTKGMKDPSQVNIVVAPDKASTAEQAVPILDAITKAGANAVLDLAD